MLSFCSEYCDINLNFNHRSNLFIVLDHTKPIFILRPTIIHHLCTCCIHHLSSVHKYLYIFLLIKLFKSMGYGILYFFSFKHYLPSPICWIFCQFWKEVVLVDFILHGRQSQGLLLGWLSCKAYSRGVLVYEEIQVYKTRYILNKKEEKKDSGIYDKFILDH